MAGGGYEYDFVGKESELEEYLCIVCRSVAKEPKQINCCGKIVCTVCLQRCEQRSKSCPHCRKHLQHFTDTRSHQKIISLHVRCNYTSNGCTWVGELKTYEEKHFSNCMFQVAECPECHEKNIPKVQLKVHVEQKCKKRPAKCPHCPCKGTYEFVFEEHALECRFWLVDCPSGCDKKMTRSEIEVHRQTCILQIVSCCYRNNGCQVMVKRTELKTHEEGCSKKLTGSTTLTTGQQQTIQQNEKNLISPIMLKFREFQRYKDSQEQWISQPFYCFEEGYRVCLVVYPDGGTRSSKGTHLSCYIHLHPGHFDDEQQWPFRGIVTVSLRNQVEDDKHHEKDFRFVTCESSVCNSKPTDGINIAGIGESLFIKQDSLVGKNNVQYLKDDELVFHIRYDTLPNQQPYNCHVVSNSYYQH